MTTRRPQRRVNSGDWEAARPVARRTLDVFSGDAPIVMPSASCAAMMREGYPMLMPGPGEAPAFELVEFLVRELGVSAWPPAGGAPEREVGAPHPCPSPRNRGEGFSGVPPLGSVNRRVAYHRACHGRGLHLGDMHERLLATIPGLELVPFEQAEQCCGFGGAFSASHGPISAGIGLEKLRHIEASGVDTFASGDMGCLLHLRGLIERHGLGLRTLHIAQILAEALPA